MSKQTDIINTIESIRRHNNLNWMDLLRLAVECEPIKAKQILARIKKDDAKIHEHLSCLYDSLPD